MWQIIWDRWALNAVYRAVTHNKRYLHTSSPRDAAPMWTYGADTLGIKDLEELFTIS